MERHEILEAMTELKLYGMRASFDEIAGKGLTRRDEIYPLIASLIRAERTHRQARSISYRISGAKFPVLKDLDKFVFADTTIDEGQVRELATGAFLDAKRNAIFIGGTGTGKTHLCIGVASAVVRSRARGRFFNLVDLVNQLEQEKAAGRSGRLAEMLCCANIAPAVACQPAEASTDPDGCWHTEACHPIQHIASNLCFDLLTGQSPGEESPSNDGFVSIHCSLNEASPVVARTTLPAHATMPFDGCNMLIALRRPARTQNRCRPRWNDDVSLRMPISYRVVDSLTIICAVCYHRRDRGCDLIK